MQRVITMTHRDLWKNIMQYGSFDRMPVLHWKGWPETYERWYQEGLPKNANEHQFFRAIPIHSHLNINLELYPEFAEETIEETASYRIFRQTDGVVAQHWKNKSCIPHFLDFTLRGADGWEEYERRLQPDLRRIPADFNAQIAKAKATDAPISIAIGSMIGWLRNWMGVENLAYLCYDDRTLLGEMVNTIADLVCWSLDQILPKVQVDCGWGWEDICFRSGPLISPKIFAEVAVPGYQKIARKLFEYGIDLYLVDCDGMIDDLVPLWMEGGVNVLFPIEIGAWKADPHAFRKKYGKHLRIIGGIDKLAIPKGKAAVDEEIERRLPLMAEGGFIPLPDHLITPETSLRNYQYYLERIRSLRF